MPIRSPTHAIIVLILATFCFIAGTDTWAQTSEPEPERGTGMIAGGISLLAVGGTIGITSMMIGLISGDCSEDSNPARCQSQANQWLLGGLLLTGASAGIGIPLIVSGAHERKAWKSWRDRQQDGSDAGERDTSAFRLSLIPLKRGAAALLTYEIP